MRPAWVEVWVMQALHRQQRERERRAGMVLLCGRPGVSWQGGGKRRGAARHALFIPLL